MVCIEMDKKEVVEQAVSDFIYIEGDGARGTISIASRMRAHG